MKKESVEEFIIGIINSDESASKFNDVTEYRNHLKKCIEMDKALRNKEKNDTSNK